MVRENFFSSFFHVTPSIFIFDTIKEQFSRKGPITFKAKYFYIILLFFDSWQDTLQIGKLAANLKSF